MLRAFRGMVALQGTFLPSQPSAPSAGPSAADEERTGAAAGGTSVAAVQDSEDASVAAALRDAITAVHALRLDADPPHGEDATQAPSGHESPRHAAGTGSGEGVANGERRSQPPVRTYKFVRSVANPDGSRIHRECVRLQ